jgi:hypothetical protein
MSRQKSDIGHNRKEMQLKMLRFEATVAERSHFLRLSSNMGLATHSVVPGIAPCQSTNLAYIISTNYYWYSDAHFTLMIYI